MLHHRGKCAGRISHPETGTDDCHVCVRPVEGTRTGCRKCGEYDEAGDFIQFGQNAIGSQAIPRAVNFEFDGVFGGDIADRTFIQEFGSVGTYSSEANTEYRQSIIDGVPSSGTLLNRQALALYYKRAWELGAPIRDDFASAQACYDYYDQTASCGWYLASLSSAARKWQYGNKVTYSSVSGTWSYTCGNNGPSVHLATTFAYTERLGAKTAYLPTGGSGVIDSGVEEWTWPSAGALLYLASYSGVVGNITRLFPPISSGGITQLTVTVGVPGKPWSWKNGNLEDYVSELCGGGRVGGAVGGGDSTYALSADSSMFYFTTGDQFRLEDPAYYSVRCREAFSYRSACNKSSLREGWFFALSNYNSINGTVQQLTLYGVQASVYGLGSIGTIGKSTITKSGYPQVSGLSGNFADEVGSNYFGSGECPYYGTSLTTTTHTDHECVGPGPTFTPYTAKVFTVTAMAPDPTGLGAGGCCNLYVPVPYNPSYSAISARGVPLSVGRVADTDLAAVTIASPTNYQWWAGKYWSTSQLNRACDFQIFSGTAGISTAIFRFMPGEVDEWVSKIGWSGQISLYGTPLPVQSQVFELAIWRSKPNKGWDHCEKNSVEIELVRARDIAHGVSWPRGKPNCPSEFPATGVLRW